jgi:hypothetical protein
MGFKSFKTHFKLLLTENVLYCPYRFFFNLLVSLYFIVAFIPVFVDNV